MPDEEADYLRVTHPFATNIRRCPFDLHVLGTPPAFVLSQDQTLQYIEESLTQKINEVCIYEAMFSYEGASHSRRCV